MFTLLWVVKHHVYFTMGWSFFFQCCSTSTKTIKTVRDREPGTSTSTLTQLLRAWYVHFDSHTAPESLVRPLRLSHSSSAMRLILYNEDEPTSFWIRKICWHRNKENHTIKVTAFPPLQKQIHGNIWKDNQARACWREAAFKNWTRQEIRSSNQISASGNLLGHSPVIYVCIDHRPPSEFKSCVKVELAVLGSPS